MDGKSASPCPSISLSHTHTHAGTIRGDQIYPPGLIRLKDIMKCFPFEDPVIVILVTGAQLRGALENGLSLYPALEGRFPQVSNINFTFDPSLPRGSRITKLSVDGKPLDPEHKYKLATRGYMGRGKDGYDDLLVASEGGTCKEIVNEENGVLISTILRQYFMSLKVMNRWKGWGASMVRVWGGVQEGMRCSIIASHNAPKFTVTGSESMKAASAAAALADKEGEEDVDSSDDEGADPAKGAAARSKANAQEDNLSRMRRCSVMPFILDVEQGGDERRHSLARRVLKKWRRLAGLKGDFEAVDSQGEDEFSLQWTKAIAPKVEGRITMVGQ